MRAQMVCVRWTERINAAARTPEMFLASRRDAREATRSTRRPCCVLAAFCASLKTAAPNTVSRAVVVTPFANEHDDDDAVDDDNVRGVMDGGGAYQRVDAARVSLDDTAAADVSMTADDGGAALCDQDAPPSERAILAAFFGWPLALGTGARPRAVIARSYKITHA